MSDNNNDPDPFDFALDSINTNELHANAGEDVFDLDNPFGDDVVMSSKSADNLPANTEEPTFDLGDPIGNDLDTSDTVAPEGSVSEDNPYLNASTSKKKKGLGGWLSKSKDKPEKEKKINLKKEKTEKEKKPVGEQKPLELAEILCIAFSVFLLVSLLIFNVAAILTRGPESTIMQTLCFIGAFNIVGLVAAAVPILFYKFPQERTLPNVMLGISAVASFGGLLMLLTEFYRYSFILKP